MGELKLNEEQISDKEKQLSKLYNYIGLIIDKEVRQITMDKERMGFLLSSKQATFITDAFWSYFKTKYKIGDIEKYYRDKNEMMKEIFRKCLMPFNLIIDVKYSRFDSKKDKFSNIIKSLKFWLMDGIQRINLSNIAAIVLIIILGISFYCFKINYIWLSNFFMGISSGIIAALIITTINKHINKIVSGFEVQEKMTKEQVSAYLKSQQEKIEYLKTNIKDEGEFFLTMDALSHLLNQHLKSMSCFERISIQEFYMELSKVNEKMSKKMSDYAKQLLFERNETQIKVGKNSLILLVFDLEIATEEYKKDVDVYLRARRGQMDIIKQNKI